MPTIWIKQKITTTRDLHDFYEKITQSVVHNQPKTFFKFLRYSHPHFREYLRQLGLKRRSKMSDTPIIFVENSLDEHPRDDRTSTCCEHVALHASMALSGHGKIFIDPQMILQY